jgi:hypothetical protein
VIFKKELLPFGTLIVTPFDPDGVKVD